MFLTTGLAFFIAESHAPGWQIGLAGASLGLAVLLFSSLIWGWPIYALAERLEIPVGAIGFIAPVEYQRKQLLHVIKEVPPYVDTLDYTSIEGALRMPIRTGTKPIYEPLKAVTAGDGLDELVRTGYLVTEGSGFKIVRLKGKERFKRYWHARKDRPHP